MDRMVILPTGSSKFFHQYVLFGLFLNYFIDRNDPGRTATDELQVSPYYFPHPYFLQHGQLHTWLFNLINGTNSATSMFKKTVVKSHASSVTLENGHVLTLNMLVEANGANSLGILHSFVFSYSSLIESCLVCR